MPKLQMSYDIKTRLILASTRKYSLYGNGYIQMIILNINGIIWAKMN